MKIPLTDFQLQCLDMINALVAGDAMQWLLPSYVMAHVRIESGWDPAIKASDFAKTGSIGLMQVSTSTLSDRVADGSITKEQAADQTDPANSLSAGIAQLAWSRRYLLRAWGLSEVLYHPVCEAYNEGVGNVVDGKHFADRYFLKWATAQLGYSFVDTERFA